ncbi:MAG TPA: hypothetical protein VFO76_03055 [Candidatus Kapabacteria bacterium]|nr:hypothetical protein [Candidatus Kapabacteria bacterium]
MTGKILPILAKILLALAAVVLVTITFFYPITGQDAHVHLNWLSQFPSLFSDGTLYPRWMPDSFSGFGSPAFYFYPPLVYWSAGLVSLTGITEPVALYRIVSLLFLLLSALTAYWYLKRISFSDTASVFGAIAYAVFPYRFTDIYLRNALSEHAAFVFIPIILISLYELHQCNSSRLRIIIISAIGWGGLLLTNVPVSAIMIYTTIAYGVIYKLYQKQYQPKLIAFVLGSMLGVVIAATFLFPAQDLAEALSTKNLWNLQSGDHPLTGYAVIDMLHDLGVKTFYLSLIVTLVLGIWIYFYIQKSKATIWLRYLLIFVVSLQIPYLIFPIVNFLPVLSYVQFSWRWDIWFVVAGAILAAGTISDNKISKARYLCIMVFSVCTIALAGIYYKSQKAVKPYHEAAIAQEAPEYLPASATMPYDVNIAFLEKHRRDPQIQVISGSVGIRNREQEDCATTFEASVNTTEAQLLFKRLYFPAWHLRDDRGVEYPIHSDSAGRIVATILQGRRGYRLAIVRTNEEQIGGWLSGAGLLTLLGLGITTMILRKRAASQQ